MSIDNEQEYEADLVVLLDDEGNEHEFEIIDEIENDDGYFMALIPTLNDAEGDVADADEYYISSLSMWTAKNSSPRWRMKRCSISWRTFSNRVMRRPWRTRRNNLPHITVPRM